MTLTETEEKLVSGMRKTEKAMFRCRYWLVAVGVFSCLVAGYGFFFIQQLLEKDPQLGMAVYPEMMFPILIVCAQGLFCIATAIRDWHGNATRVLLLKLIDDRLKDSKE